MTHSALSKTVAEFLGTGGLAFVIVGSSLQAARLSSDLAVQLVLNVGATVMGLWVLILLFGPVSNAHFNPAVTLLRLARGEQHWRESIAYLLAQLAGGWVGVVAANLIYEQPLLVVSAVERASFGTAVAEVIAAVGLLYVILRVAPLGVMTAATGISLWVGAAALATSSTSFANPALSFARIFASGAAGIEPVSALIFVAAHLFGVGLLIALTQVVKQIRRNRVS